MGYGVEDQRGWTYREVGGVALADESHLILPMYGPHFSETLLGGRLGGAVRRVRVLARLGQLTFRPDILRSLCLRPTPPLPALRHGCHPLRRGVQLDLLYRNQLPLHHLLFGLDEHFEYRLRVVGRLSCGRSE